MNLVRKFLKTSVVYLLGKISTYVVTFLMLGYYTANVSPSEYGQYELLFSLVNVTVPLLFLEIWSGLLRFAINGDDNEKTRVVSTTFIMLLVAVFVYTMLYGFLSFHFEFKYGLTIYFFALSFLFVNMMMMVARALSKNLLFACSGIFGAIANAATGIFFVHVHHLQCEAMLYAMIANYLIQIAILALGTRVWRYFNIKLFDTGISKEMLVFCFPFCFNTALYYVNTNFYQVVVNDVLGSEILGIFVVSTKFCIVVTFVVSVFHLAWQEMAYVLSENQGKTEIYQNGLSILTDIVLVGTVALLPFVKLVFPIIVGSQFDDANQYVPLYYSTVFFTSVSGFLYNTLAAEKITIYHPIAKLISGSINMALLCSLISEIGVYAVILGAVSSSIVEMAVLYVVSDRKINLRIQLSHICLFVILYLITCLIYYFGTLQINAIYFMFVLIVGCWGFLRVHDDVRRIAKDVLNRKRNNGAA